MYHNLQTNILLLRNCKFCDNINYKRVTINLIYVLYFWVYTHRNISLKKKGKTKSLKKTAVKKIYYVFIRGKMR